MNEVVAHFKKLNGAKGWGEWEVDQVQTPFWTIFPFLILVANSNFPPLDKDDKCIHSQSSPYTSIMMKTLKIHIQVDFDVISKLIAGDLV